MKTTGQRPDKMHRSTRALVAGTLLLFGCAHSTARDGALAVRADADATLRLLADGRPVSDRPLRIVVQEWKRRAAASAAPSAERNTVGSIVETEMLEAGVLEPAGAPWTSDIAQTAASDGDAIDLNCAFPGDLRIEARIARRDGAISVAGKLVNGSADPARREVPVTISLAIPVDDPKLRWLESLHSDLDATTAQERFDAVATTAGARGAMSRYPFGAVMGESAAVAVGFPLDRPRIQRIRWDGATKQLIAEFDAAVSPEPRDFPNEVPFEFLVFDFDREFGFRGVAQRYYELNPSSYDHRLARQGQWMPFSRVDSVRRPEDFAFQFHEYHPNFSVAWNAPNGVDSLPYCEPPVQYVNMSPGTPRDVKTVEGIVDAMDTRQGAQIRGSSTRRADGAMQAAFVETPWAVGARIPTNGDPDLPRTARDPWNSFDANWAAYEELYKRRASDKPADWNGGVVQEGVLGAEGRALFLADGETASQEAAAGESPVGSIAVLAKADGPARLSVEIARPDGTRARATVDVPQSTDMQPLSIALEPSAVVAASGSSATITLRAEGAGVWLDELVAEGLRVANAAFDAGVLDAEAPTGLYLDSFEGWDSKDLNFRREHFPYVDIPLTFDARTGESAQVVMMHNFELAAEALSRLRARGHILMGNTALYQWAWSAHYLDVLGIETSWGEGPDISPPRLAEMDYLRTMLYHKPYCYLQNLKYENFRGAKVEQYFARCFHYGFWPGFFSYNAAESPYWEDASLYDADRPAFVKYMQPQRRITAAGWEPTTLARATDAEVLCERWGGGPWRGESMADGVVYYTLYNPTKVRRTGRLVVDSRVFGEARWTAIDVLEGGMIAPVDGSVAFDLAPMATSGVMLVPTDGPAMQDAIAASAEALDELAEKYRRFGYVDSASRERARAAAASLDRAALAAWIDDTAPRLEAPYVAELRRAASNLRTLLALAGGDAPEFPQAIVPGESMTVSAVGAELSLDVAIGGHTQTVALRDGRASFAVPANAAPGDACSLVLRGRNGVPWIESRYVVASPVVVSNVPDAIVVADALRIAPSFRNNLSRAVRGKVEVSGPSALKHAVVEGVELAPGAERAVDLDLVVPARPASSDERGDILVRFVGDDGTRFEHRIPAVLLAANASILRAPDVAVRVDSTYYGYSTKPLVDGNIDATGLNWSDAAWASDESMVPHWIEFDFPRPTAFSEIVVHWAVDGDRRWTSQQLLVQVMADGEDAWRTIATADEAAPTPSTTIKLEPTTAMRLRLFQPAGKGPADRAGILWLAEVEAR